MWVYNDDQDTREGTPAFAIAAPLSPAPTHLSVVKTSPSAFSGTGLGAMLSERGIGRLVFCRLASNHCFRASVEASYSAGYYTVVAEDAHSVPLYAGKESIVDAINEDWKKGGRIELLPSASIKLSIPAAARFGLGEEGWALYAERLMAELGAYKDDPLGDIGSLQAEAFRAARLVVDTGIHAKKWTYGEAVDFMVEQGLLSRRAAQSEVIRYASLPGQATSYYIGFQRILELRERARAALGDYFDLGAFHRTILACGALPFDSLTFVVDRYIAEAKGVL